MLKLLITAIILGTLSLGAGCSTVKSTFGMGPTTVMTYHAGAQPVEATADKQGTYALYAAGDDRPRVTVDLQRDERLGFEKDPNGQLFGVAGNQKYPLPSNEDYYWQRK